MTHHFRAIMRKHKSSVSLFSASLEGLFWMMLFFLLVFTSSCSKDVAEPPAPPPPVENKTLQIDLGNKVIPFWGRIETIDFDKDNFPELIFEIVPVGDHILKRDRWLWQIKTTRFTALPINLENDQIPVLSKGDSIFLDDLNGNEWYHGSLITLFEKIMDDQGNTWWEGNWKGATHKYLPFKVLRADGYYAGWVEISSDAVTEKGYLHRAGISKVADKGVKAGY
jgi:hypothetical protein